MNHDNIESLEGYNGLLHEVAIEDCYKLKQLNFIPDVILDLGGNVGIFSRFAKELFPKSQIISIEPDEYNYRNFKMINGNDKNITILNKAIGIGKVWRYTNPLNFAHECYISSGLGYPNKEMIITEKKGTIKRIKIKTIMPDKLINKYIKNCQKSLIKIDIEGNEHTIFTHQPSINALKKIDYIAMEVHFYALRHGLLNEVRNTIIETLHQFDDTHIWELNNVNFYARKK